MLIELILVLLYQYIKFLYFPLLHHAYQDNLYEKFHIDKRNENEINESPTQYEPIFQYENNNLVFRYQRELIEAGYKKMNQSLTSIQKDALNALDRALAKQRKLNGRTK